MDKKANLTPLPTTPREDRLWKRCEILCKNFSDEDYGVDLMISCVRGMFETFASTEAEFTECQILAKLYELEAWLFQYKEMGDADGTVED